MQNKERNELYITIALSVVLVILIVQSFSRLNKQKKIVANLSVPQSKSLSEKKDQGLYATLEKEMTKVRLVRDPFFQQPIADSTQGGMRVTGIAWDEVHPTAILNGQVIKPGDEIIGYKVANIMKNKVILTDGFRNVELNLESEIEKIDLQPPSK